jgi:hypothetical protein
MPDPARSALDEDLQRRTERWFVRRGLPHFIDHYNAREDIFTRAAPFLAVVFVLSLVNVRIGDESLVRNVVSLGLGVAVGLGGVALVNVLRGRKPLSRPRRIGAPELVTFVVAGPVVQLLVEGWTEAAVSLAFNLVILGLTYVVTSFGLIPMTRWAIGQMLRMFADVTTLFARSLPLLLLLTIFMFFNAELWKIADDIPTVLFVSALVVLVAVGTVFIVLRFPRELDVLSRFDDWSQVTAEAADSPLAGTDAARLPEPPAAPPLDRPAWANVGLVLFFSQAVQVVLVTAAIFCFYVLFGLFTMVPSTIRQWTGTAELDALATFDYLGVKVTLTSELLRTSGFVAAIAGLQFTVSALVDTTYRDEFFKELTHEIRESLAVRTLYLSLLGRTAPA